MIQERQIVELAAQVEQYHVLHIGVHERKPTMTPMEPHFHLHVLSESFLGSVPFGHLVGSLLWIVTHLDPGIMQHVMYLAKICTC